MRDKEIRAAMLDRLSSLHQHDADTLVLEELGLLFGEVRADIAVVNGALHGFEIKSDRDTLRRLPRQATVYQAVLDTVTLVCTERHLRRAKQVVPRWWGLIVAWPHGPGMPRLEPIRPALQNMDREALAVASMLWREEALSLLDRHGAADGMRSKPRRRLHRRLAELLTLDCLAAETRHALRARQGWRSDARS